MTKAAESCGSYVSGALFAIGWFVFFDALGWANLHGGDPAFKFEFILPSFCGFAGLILMNIIPWGLVNFLIFAITTAHLFLLAGRRWLRWCQSSCSLCFFRRQHSVVGWSGRSYRHPCGALQASHWAHRPRLDRAECVDSGVRILHAFVATHLDLFLIYVCVCVCCVFCVGGVLPLVNCRHFLCSSFPDPCLS